MNPKLVGTWFLVRNGDVGGEYSNNLMVIKAKAVIPSKSDEGAFESIDSESSWMCLDREDDKFWRGDYDDITPADFNALNLPEVTYENSPIEIEIMPSGNVYFY